MKKTISFPVLLATSSVLALAVISYLQHCVADEVQPASVQPEAKRSICGPVAPESPRKQADSTGQSGLLQQAESPPNHSDQPAQHAESPVAPSGLPVQQQEQADAKASPTAVPPEIRDLLTNTAGKLTGEESANEDPPKSWTKSTDLAPSELQFLNGLKWEPHLLGAGYVLSNGLIYSRWVAATKFLKDGKMVLVEITPPQEYVTVVDPLTGAECPEDQLARDVNADGILEIALLHRKLHDPNYHMYTIYALEKTEPKLLWKSGGKIGDWVPNI